MLCDNLVKKINEKGEGFCHAVLSRITGILYETILKIIKGRSKNPGIYTIAKLADALNCSIDELVDRKDFIQKNTEHIRYDKILLSTVFDYVMDFIQKNTLTKCNFLDTITAVAEIYKYSLNNELNNLEARFAEWFCEKQISSEKNIKIMLRDNLTKKINEKEDNLPTLAHKTGIHYETLLRIVKGDTKNPGVYTIAKLADVLNCSIDELVDRKAFSETICQKNKKHIKYDKAVLDKVVKYTINLTQYNNLTKCNFIDIISAIIEIYEYSLEHDSNSLDARFSDWFCKKQISKGD